MNKIILNDNIQFCRFTGNGAHGERIFDLLGNIGEENNCHNNGCQYNDRYCFYLFRHNFLSHQNHAKSPGKGTNPGTKRTVPPLYVLTVSEPI